MYLKQVKNKASLKNVVTISAGSMAESVQLAAKTWAVK
jgi:hypothetical protein